MALETGSKDLQRQVADVSKQLEETTARHQDESQKRQLAEKKAKDQVATAESITDQMSALKYQHDSLKAKHDFLQSAHEELDAKHKAVLTRVGEADKEVILLNSQLEQAHQEIYISQHRAQQAESAMATLTQQKQAESIRWESKLRSVQTELSSHVDDVKTHCSQLLADANKATTAAVEDRRQVEEQYHKAKDEVLQLHQMLDRIRQDHQNSVDNWDKRKAEMDSAILNHRRTVHATEDEFTQTKAQHAADMAEAIAQQKRLREEMDSRTEEFQKALSLYGEAVRSLRQETVKSRDRTRELGSQCQQLLSWSALLQTRISGPWNQYKPELETAFAQLVAKHRGAKDRHEDAQDEISRLQVAIEAEKSHSLQLEEQLSQCLHERSELSEKLNAGDKLEQDKIAALLKARQDSEMQRSELQERLSRAQQALEKTSEQVLGLQESNQSLQVHIK